jgi:hypothetical protein
MDFILSLDSAGGGKRFGQCFSHVHIALHSHVVDAYGGRGRCRRWVHGRVQPPQAHPRVRTAPLHRRHDRKYIYQDKALERRFQQVYVCKPSPEDTVSILRGLKPRYELHHTVRIRDEALLAASKLSSRYLPDRFLLDKGESRCRERQGWDFC